MKGRIAYVGVAAGHRDRGVAEKLLDDVQASARPPDSGGEIVAEVMEVEVSELGHGRKARERLRCPVGSTCVLGRLTPLPEGRQRHLVKGPDFTVQF